MVSSNHFEARAFALVASALSDEYGVKVTVGGTQAYTGFTKGKKPVINIPALDLKDQKYQVLVRGYLDHEAGHVRFTESVDTNSMVNKVGVVQHIANIYEDVYVERMMSQCFPGCKRNLRHMAEMVYAAGEEGNGPDDPSPFMKTLQNYHDGAIDAEQFARALWGAILNYILFRIRGQVVDSIANYIPKHKQPVDMMMPGLTAVIDPILDRVPVEGVNTEANNTLAVETEKTIRDFIGDNQKQMDSAWGGGDEGGDGAGQATGRSDEKSTSGEQKDEQDNGHPDGSGQDEESPEQGGCDDNQQSGTSAGGEPSDSSGTSGGTGGVRQETQDITDEFNIAGELMEEDNGPGTDIAKQVTEAISETIDNSEEAKELHPYDTDTKTFSSSTWNAAVKLLSDEEVKNSVQASVALDAQLQSLLQTYTLNRGGVSRMGKLDTNRLHKLVTGSDKIFKRRVEKQGINTEVVIAVDMSGSMCEANKATLTSMSLYAVMKSLRKIQGCTSSVLGFSSGEVIDILRPGDRLTTRMQIQPNGGTHCGEALVQAMCRFSPSPDSRKIVIMMTDGVTSNSEFFEYAIQSAKNSGIEMVGIGILDRAIQHYLPVNECCIIKNLDQMTPEFFRILRTKLLRSAV